MLKKIICMLTLGLAAVTTTACGVHGHVGGAHAGAGIH